MPHLWDPTSVAPEEALKRLVAGNKRFLDAAKATEGRPFHPDQAEQPQRPFAVVIGCSDSRNPVEIVFDQGFGELFVIRLAGHVIAPSAVGSVEFAVAELGARLVVVLGHTRCGAVTATLRALHTGDGPESRNIQAITHAIAPSVVDLLHDRDPADMRTIRDAVRAHVLASTEQLRHGSPLLEQLIQAGRIRIVGAEYELETGRVRFLDKGPR